MNKKISSGKIIAAVIAVIIVSFFAADAVRVKKYRLPPLFSVPAAVYSDGESRVYYGAGYKIWHDVNTFDEDETENYYITLWILPNRFSI